MARQIWRGLTLFVWNSNTYSLRSVIFENHIDSKQLKTFIKYVA
jgi:hypothetical protein